MEKRVRPALVITAIIICSMLLISFHAVKKTNLHEDEIMTFLLSNSKTAEKLYPGYLSKSDVNKLFMDSMCASKDSLFDYRQVFENQAMDVHPPLYYVIIHTLCSFFSGRFIPQLAVIVNLVFMTFSILMFYSITKYFLEDVKYRLLLTGFFALCPGEMEIASFLRMYIVALFFVLVQLEKMLKLYIYDKEKINFCDYLILFLGAGLGALTHYYSTFFTICFGVMFFVFKLKDRKIADAFKMLAALVIAAAFALTVFPAMIIHVLYGYRGTEAIANSINIFDFPYRIGLYILKVNRNLFGGLLVIFIAAFIYYRIKQKKAGYARVKMESYVFYIFIATLIYSLFVMKTSAYIEPRYVSLAYPCIILLTFGVFLHKVESGEFKFPDVKGMDKINRLSPFVKAFAILLVVTLLGSVLCRYEYSLSESRNYLKICNENADKDCVFVMPEYDTWMINQHYKELLPFKSVTFVKSEKPFAIKKAEVASEESFIVFINDYDSDKRDIIADTLKERCENVTKVTPLYSYKLATVYLFE